MAAGVGSWMVKKGSFLNMMSLLVILFLICCTERWVGIQHFGFFLATNTNFQQNAAAKSGKDLFCSSSRSCILTEPYALWRLHEGKILEEYYIKNSFECFKYFPLLQQNLFLWHSRLHFHVIYSAGWTKANLINDFLVVAGI